MLAAASNRTTPEVIELLIKSGQKVNPQDYIGASALMYASYSGNTAVLAKLINFGGDFGAEDLIGKTILHYAAEGGQVENVKYLVEVNGRSVYLIDKDKRWTALHYAAINDHLDVVKYLLSQKASINAEDINGKTPFQIAKSKAIKDYLTSVGGR